MNFYLDHTHSIISTLHESDAIYIVLTLLRTVIYCNELHLTKACTNFDFYPLFLLFAECVIIRQHKFTKHGNESTFE